MAQLNDISLCFLFKDLDCVSKVSLRIYNHKNTGFMVNNKFT